ncbi:MAG: Holliday junction branch migration protein RuvA [Planctomycetota bacterium]
MLAVIAEVTGQIERIDGQAALLRPDGMPSIALEVLLPAYAAAELAGRVAAAEPARVTLRTQAVLESVGQGTSFVPRLLGFERDEDRRFFELFTTVKGVGQRKALRAMARPTAWIAGAIAGEDAAALKSLPEVGPRLAQTIIAELSGKLDDLAIQADGAPGTVSEPKPPAAGPAAEAISALVALGQTRPEAERLIALAIERLGEDADSGALVEAAFAHS